MRVAVVSLTRDRLRYTQECFASLRRHAGCRYDHYVVDNGSEDGTAEWLEKNSELFAGLTLLPENIGISAALNLVIGDLDLDGYDVIVKYDNDCRLTQPGTLRDVCDLVVRGGAILSPRILGLRNPPQTLREVCIGDERILEVAHVGGVFLAVQAGVFDHFRYGEHSATWGGDDSEICQWFRAQGGTCGYVARLEAWHHETTDGQKARYPEYQARKERELAELGRVAA